jgi:subtilisin family serine protease
VVIALLDTGIEYRHPDVRNRLWTNRGEVPNNGLDDDGNGFIDDYYGYDFLAGSPEVLPTSEPHGAYVAGLLVGDGTGGTVTGVAPDARVMVLKGSALVFTFQAFQYALDMGADIVNMSFSIPDLGNLRGLWRLAADNATAAGLVLVSGAGNFRQSQTVPTQLRTPEAIPSVIAVGGVDAGHRVTTFSSGGPVTWSGVKFYDDFPLAAGGLVKPDLAGFPGPGYTTLAPSASGGYIGPESAPGGNSFSGPQAAGIAALVLSLDPERTAWDVREILESTARDLGPHGKDNDTGWGLLDAAAAVQAARDGG